MATDPNLYGTRLEEARLLARIAGQLAAGVLASEPCAGYGQMTDRAAEMFIHDARQLWSAARREVL